MKKRNNPKIDAMRERSLMVESERQYHERNYSLNEQDESKVDYIGHNVNMGQIIFTLQGWRVNGDVISIFLKPKELGQPRSGPLNNWLYTNSAKNSTFKLNFDMKNNTTEWDFGNVEDSNVTTGTDLIKDIEESMVEFNVDSVDLSSGNVDVPLRHLILTTKSKTGKISEEEKQILTKLDGYINQMIKK